MKVAGLLVGMGFGFVLGWSRLTDYDVIRNMLLLREFDVFLMMGSAVVTAAITARILRAAGARSLVGGSPIAWSVSRPTRDHVYGSVLFGVGWAISGTCPGPVAAQLGRGQLAALFTLAGVALHGWYFKRSAEGTAAPSRKFEVTGIGPGL